MSRSAGHASNTFGSDILMVRSIWGFWPCCDTVNTFGSDILMIRSIWGVWPCCDTVRLALVHLHITNVASLLIVSDGKHSTQKNVRCRRTRCNHWPIKFLKTSLRTFLLFPCWRLDLLIDAVSASEYRPRRSSGVSLAYTDPSGEWQQAPSMPRWGPSSLQKSFRQAIASSVHAAAVGSA